MANTSQIGKPKVEHKRHIAKTITWRIVGSLDTFLLSYFVIGYIGEWNLFGAQLSDDVLLKKAEIAGLLTGLEVFTKTLLYYFHERVWFNIDWISKQQIRHIIKTISWRLVGAIDTIILVYFVFYIWDGEIKGAAEVALAIFSLEIITKMILYYLHERAWYTFAWGVIKS